jgi:hypothetical protein
MRNTHKILSVLLALMLVASNIAYSDHVSSHASTDFGSCSFCFHHGGTDTAIAPQACTLFVQTAGFKYEQNFDTFPFLQVISHDHMSRAPPVLT